MQTLQQELEAPPAAPERAAVQDWIAFRILDLLPDPVELHLHPAVQRPVHSNRECLVACQENVLRPWIAKRETVIRRADAVEPEPLVARSHLDGAEATARERIGRLDGPAFSLARDHPGASHIPGLRAGVGKGLIIESLVRPAVADVCVLGTCG